MSGLLLLCPGQGHQHPAMYALARTGAAGAALLDRLSPPPPADLYRNGAAQPMIVAATLAMWEAIREFAPRPALVAGYSVGELSAYAVAGALAPEDAMELAALRARLMDQSLATHPGQAMLAMAGLPLRRCAELAACQLYHVAIETGEDACVAGGPAAGLAALEQMVGAAGGRCTRLPVHVASHTPYMATAVAPFAAALHGTPFHAMDAPVLAGISAVPVDGKALAVEQLSRQLNETIRWQACMDACAEAGITVALELGPGAALSRMLGTRHPRIACRSVADFRSLDGIRAWLARQLNE